MSGFYINHKEIDKEVENLESIAESISKCQENLDSINIGNTDEYAILKKNLKEISNAIHEDILSIRDMKITLKEINQLYKETEQTIINSVKNTSKIDEVLWEKEKNEILELFDSIVASLKGNNNESVEYGGDPVNLSTGNFVYEKEDIVEEGTLPLSLTRFYNAMDKRSGVMGKGWRHPYEVSLILEERRATLILEDGKEEFFDREEIFLGKNTVNKLEKVEDGYKYQTLSGYIYFFDNSGKYIRFRDFTGNELELFYEEKQLKKVSRVRDDVFFLFEYDEIGKLIEVRDQENRYINYEYDEAGRMIKSINAQGEVYGYKYDDMGRIEAIVNPEGVTSIQNKYDKEGRTVSQSFPDGGIISFIYEDEKQCVTVTERNGSKVSYYHDENYRNVRTVYEDGEEEFLYNQKDQCVLYKDCNQNITRYAYDINGNITQIIDALGVKSNATYDRNNRLLKLSVNGKEKIKNVYDNKGNLIESKDALGRSTFFSYKENGKMKCIIQADGSSIYLNYDEKGNVNQVIDAYGNCTSYVYDNIGRVQEEISPRGAKIKFAYDKMNRITSIVDAYGNITQYEYTLSGKIKKIKYPDGTERKTEYNNMNFPYCEIDENGNITGYEYDNMWNISKVETADGSQKYYHYNSKNLLAYVTDSLGNCIEYKYDANGNKIWEKGAEGEELTYSYDAKNRLICIQNAEGGMIEYEYDMEDNVTVIRDALGNETKFVYDEAGQKISETNPEGQVVKYTYTNMGNLATVTNEDGNVIRYKYLPGGRLSEILYPDNTRELFTWDEDGNLIKKKNRKGGILHYTYDIMGRLTCMEGSRGQKEYYKYDAVGNLISIEDVLGNKTEYKYDGVGNLIYVLDALGIQNDYYYDKVNRLIEINRNNKLQIRYKRDLNGRICEVEDALGIKEITTYDGSGRVFSQKDRDGYVTKFIYDGVGRLSKKVFGSGKEVSYKYNLAGNLEQIEDWSGTTNIVNDTMGRVREIKYPNGEKIAYTYGKSGQRSGIVYPDGSKVQYEYNSSMYLTALGEGEEKIYYTYDENGRMKEKRLPNGIRTLYKYSATGELLKMESSDKEGILDCYEYQYDLMGNPIRIRKERRNLSEESGNYEYQYDSLGRLTEVKRNQEVLRTYGYDSNGNRTYLQFGKADNQKMVHYRYNEVGQLIYEESEKSKKEYHYDGRGNLKEILENNKTVMKYHYGDMNRLEKAENVKGSKVCYHYNGLGYRISKNIQGRTGNSENITYFVDMTTKIKNLLGSSTNGNYSTYLWDGNVAVLKEKGRKNYYLTDELGSPIRLAGQQGEIRETYGYDEFGCDLYGNIGKEQPFGFTGYQVEEIGKIYFAQAREYAPKQGRFTSEDIIKGFIEYPETMNHYVYCYNNPKKYVDEDGEFAILATIAIGAVIGTTVNAGISAATQYLETGEVNWKTVAVDAGKGAIKGGIAGTGAGLLITTATNAVVDAAGNVVQQTWVEGKSFQDIDVFEVATTASWSAVETVAFDKAGKLIGKAKTKIGIKGPTKRKVKLKLSSKDKKTGTDEIYSLLKKKIDYTKKLATATNKGISKKLRAINATLKSSIRQYAKNKFKSGIISKVRNKILHIKDGEIWINAWIYGTINNLRNLANAKNSENMCIV